jgi:hypothetical protein
MEMGPLPKRGVCKMIRFILAAYKVQLVCDDDDDDDAEKDAEDDDDDRTFLLENIRLLCFSIG